MRQIVLARIDDRLIHGQIVTSWCKSTNASTILIVDDRLSEDNFTSDFCVLPRHRISKLKLWIFMLL